MKLFLISILFLSGFISEKQIPNGIYESSKESYRTGYFLVVNYPHVSLFGWEVTNENDTVYFRSTINFELINQSTNQLTFKNFEFQKVKLTKENVKDFKTNSKLKVESMLLLRYLNDVKESNGKIRLTATKDAYDSRSDSFEFKKITDRNQFPAFIKSIQKPLVFED